MGWGVEVEGAKNVDLYIDLNLKEEERRVGHSVHTS